MSSFLLLAISFVAQPVEPVLQFRVLPKNGCEVVAQLPPTFAAKLPLGRWTQEQGEGVLTVALIADDTKKTGPAMLGKYERTGNVLTFTPRFPLAAGQTYRANYYHPVKLTTFDQRMAPAAAKTPPKVVKIFPTANVLPANTLKFYIYFDRPMRGGKEIFNQIVLVDDKGKVIDDPWLIDEIWDEDNNCLIIYIHPGRIKWGVDLRELLGPVLYEKREYSLVIRGMMADLEGNKIGKDVVKKFRTTAEDRVRIDLSQWKLEPAIAGTSERLHVRFPKAIDHRSLQRFLSVTDDKGQRVEGKFEIGKDEKSWSFLPSKNWRGAYHLNVDPQLEDVAGNTPDRPFDFDLKSPKMAPQKLRLEFQSLPN